MFANRYSLLKNWLFLMAICLLTTQSYSQVVISQVYGGGGNTGAPYTNDFIELFNRSNTSVSLSGMSVQYASATGTTWSVTTLPNFTLNPGQYFLVRQAGGANGVALPTPDATGTIAMSATAGKIALVSSTVALTGACPTAGVIDFVGFGSTANCFEGTGPTAAPSATLAVLRAANGCTDSNNNSANFSTATPNPRNSSSALNVCPLPLTASSTSGTIACFGGTTSVTVSATGGTAPYTGTGTFTVSAGTYSYTVTDNAGATATTSITVTQPTAITSSSSATACGSYLWNGTTYSASGSYSYATTASNGCDSTANLVLTINNATTSSTSISSQSPYTWNGTTYSASGTYTFSTTNSVGCDSTATLILTISAAPCTPTTSTSTATACNSYNWNGNTYTATGSYTYTTLNAGGCDSTATLLLTINNSTTSSTSATACNSYSWNGNTYTSSGTYTYSTTNAAGCDSTATLVLTIRNSSTSTINASSCNSYTWNGNTYTSSGTYTYNSTNAAGCDSIATLNLTINTYSSQVVVFSESMGLVGSTTPIATHETNNGFDNDVYTMSGTADIRSTSTSNTYTGASGAANVFFTNNGTASFQISGINTVGVSNLVLGFGNLKTTTASNGSELVVETSTDGTNFSPLSVTPMNTGTGTTGWQYRTSSGSIPNAANLTIRWRTTSTAIQFRIDDVKLSGSQTGSASITASGPTTFCPGSSVTLTCSGASSFSWSSGETTQSVTLTTTGSYSCVATDANGCTSTTNSISINGDDFTAPTAICQNITVPLDINGEAIITAAQINNGSSDNCGISSLSLSNDYFTAAELGINNVDLFVIDNIGNISTCTATVTVIDGFGPTMNCNNLTVYLDANGTATITPAQVDNGSFDGDGIDTLYLSRSTLTCADIAVAGATAPTDLIISEYLEGSVNNKCIELYNGTSSPIDLTNGSYQLRFFFNGAITASTTINLAGIVAPGETHVVCASNSDANVLSLADQVSASFFFNGDDAVQLTKDFGFTVLDVFGRIGEDPGNGWGVAPLSTVDQTLRRRSTVTSGVNVNPASGFPTLNTQWNAFPVDNISNLGSHFMNSTSGGTTVTLTGVDPSGNVSTCASTITVLDTVSPIAACKNVTLYLDATGNASLIPAQIDNGSNDNCGIASMNVSQLAFTCANIGSNSVTLTVADVYGNSASCSATVTVLDTLPPAAGFQNVTVYLDSNGNATLAASQVNNNTTDNCGTPTISVTPTSFDCGDLGTVPTPTDLLISEYVEGSSNNKCVEIYNGTSNAINLATSGYQLRLYFNGATTFTTINLTGTVAAGGTHLICNTAATAPFLAVANQTSGSMTYNGDDAVVLFKTSGNQIVDVFGRIGEDPGTSWISGSLNTADQTLRRKSSVITGVTTNPASGFPTLATQWTIAGLDNTSNLGSHFMIIGNNTAQFTVTDAGGNSMTVPVGVSVKDTIKPVASCQNLSINLNGSGTASITAAQINNGSSDNCGISNMTVSPSSFTCANTGANTVTLTVTDLDGNTSTCTATVTVSDNSNPTITAPAAISATTNTGCTATGVSLGTPTTGDNCTVASVTNNAPSVFPLGSTTVTWTVTDGSGNTATATQVVTVTDNVNPTITAPVAVSANTNTGCTATGVSLGTPTTADNCSVASVTNNAPSAFPLGTTTVTWTVTDGSGNTATAIQVVTVTDNVNPTITAPSNKNVTTNSGCTATSVSLGTPTTADNCSVASVTNNAPSAFPLGTTTVTWTVTDGSGNTATATQTVTVTDNVNPTITAPAAVSATTNTSCTATGVSLGTPTTADNCSVASITNNAPSAFPLGTTTVTWTVTDGSGNTATATQ
ncbi:MAG: beta strand repeat-containing protein, partial [Bacteroidota bacterium]